MQLSEYISRIMRNRKIINNLSEADYPALYRFLNQRGQSMKNRLLFIFDKAQRTPNQQGDKYGYWFFCPLTKFAGDGRAYAATRETWEHSLILFAALGLIHRRIPTQETASTPYEEKAIATAAAKGYERATPFYTVPEYSAQQLDYIEGKARLWIEKKGNCNSFSKTTIIDIFGSEIANRIYQDERTKPKAAINHERNMADTLRLLLQQQPFTTRDELIAYTASICISESLYTASETWERAHHRILQAAGARHHRPNKAEIEAYSLKGNGWIITKL